MSDGPTRPMTFDEWVTSRDLDYLRTRDHENVIGTARDAWNAAVAAERERIATLLAEGDGKAKDWIMNRIREGTK